MPGLGVSRALIDSAGGIIANGLPTVRVNGFPIARFGSTVTGHGENQHSGSVIIVGSQRVRAGGLPVCRFMSIAACGHTATGS